jgi:diaminopimelate epimerase
VNGNRLKCHPFAMNLTFTKMSGAGNDFVVLDNRSQTLSLTREQIALLCHRQFGIGADGLLAAEPGENGADFRMRYYNSDGGEAEMCGNGARCFARYVRPFKSAGADQLTFTTPAGLIRADFVGEDVRINLTAPQGLKLAQSVSLSSGPTEIHSLNTGVPHAVLFVPNADQAYVSTLGSEIRYHAAFAPRGTNVNFVQLTGPQSIRVRTYERGVEAETLACGTGVTAAGIIAHLVHHLPLPITVRVQSGADLKVNFTRQGDGFENVTLQGPADITFTGQTSLLS